MSAQINYKPISQHAPSSGGYRGRLAPTPTGYMHLGHARTFWTAYQRARSNNGALVFRNEDLDRSRCREEFASAMVEDLRWFGLEWQEGPDCGGPFGPYTQSERRHGYLAAFERLRTGGFVYPCGCSRKDVLQALQAPHVSDEEPVYPGTCRPCQSVDSCTEADPTNIVPSGNPSNPETRAKVNWRFHVPDGLVIEFDDGNFGPQQFVAGRDFGDFVVWRHDDTPSYQLAVVVDDDAMKITEVVRGADLILSTARQILLQRALGLVTPAYYHCPLVTDNEGVRLAKRNDALSLRALRARGETPSSLRPPA